MRALVTGGGGFLGSYVVKELLAAGRDVTVIGRSVYPELEKLGVQSIAVDLRDREKVISVCKNMDEVYHVAALAGLWGPWKDFYEINFIGTENIVAACQENGVARLIYTSSPSVVFDGQSQRELDEATPYSNNWMAHYPHSKMLGEKAVLAANCETLKTVALRPHIIWGPGDSHIVPRLLDRARKGQLVIVGSGQNIVDVIYVENAAKAHLQVANELIESGKSAGKSFFLGQNEPVKLWEFINSILKREGIPIVTKRVPFFIAYTTGGLLEFLYRILRKKEEPRMTRFIACQLAKDHYYSHQEAASCFGYDAKISVDEGLDRLFMKSGV